MDIGNETLTEAPLNKNEESPFNGSSVTGKYLFLPQRFSIYTVLESILPRKKKRIKITWLSKNIFVLVHCLKKKKDLHKVYLGASDDCCPAWNLVLYWEQSFETAMFLLPLFLFEAYIYDFQ